MTGATTPRTVRVICLGNELVKDDGVGVRIGRVLKTLDLPDHVTVELRLVMGLELLDELDPTEELIIVDACVTQDGAPGACHVLDVDQAAGLARTPYSGHELGIAEVLKIAAQVAPDRLPPRAIVVAVEAQALQGYGTELSQPVREAIPDAVEAVLRALDASPELLRRGRLEAARWVDWEPTVMDLIR